MKGRETEQVTERLTEESRRRRTRSCRPRTAHFVKGPIPVVWIEAACRPGGKVSQVAWAIWFRFGATDPKEPIAITPQFLRRFSVGRNAGNRALRLLESEGLIRVDRRRGRSPRVTVLRTRVERAGADAE